MNLVLDNSVTMRWCFGDGMPADLKYADKVLTVLGEGTATVPPLWRLEVANVLVRAEHHAQIDATHSQSFLTVLQGLDIVVDAESIDCALTDTVALARTHALSAYAAAYLELALRRQLPMATLDANLRQACKRAGVTVFA